MREYSITGLADTVTIKRKGGEADFTRVARNRILRQDEKTQLELIIDKHQVVDSLLT
jgi:hypothetical protein